MSQEKNTVYFIGDSEAVRALLANHPQKEKVVPNWECVLGSVKDNSKIGIWRYSNDLISLQHDTAKLQSIEQSDVIFVVFSTLENLKKMIEELAAVGFNNAVFPNKNWYFYGATEGSVDESLDENILAFCDQNRFGFIFNAEKLRQIFDQVANQPKGTHKIEKPGFPKSGVESFDVESSSKSKSCCNAYKMQFFASAAFFVAAGAVGGARYAGVLVLTPQFIIGLAALSVFTAFVFLFLGLVNRKEAQLQNQRMGVLK